MPLTNKDLKSIGSLIEASETRIVKAVNEGFEDVEKSLKRIEDELLRKTEARVLHAMQNMIDAVDPGQKLDATKILKPLIRKE